MFRASIQTTRRINVKPLRNVRFYHGNAIKENSFNKPALLLAGITTAFGIYAVCGMPRIVKQSETKQNVEPILRVESVSQKLSEENAEQTASEVSKPEDSEVVEDITSQEESLASSTEQEVPETAVVATDGEKNATVEPSADVSESQDSETQFEEEEAHAEEISTTTTSAETVENNEASEETTQQAAYNPETGEINWDCPCLGGMAHGPCGEEFKSAFSCFVYSEAEPKGIDCVEKFQHMQDCFRKYPEYYAKQIEDEEAATAEAEKLEQSQTSKDVSSSVAVEVETENAVFEPVLEKYDEENSVVERTSKVETEAHGESPKSD